MRIFGKIDKHETLADGSLIVHGIASAESIDKDGEVVTADALRAALPEYMRFANVREMHQPSAVGKTIRAEVNDEGQTDISVKVVDPVAVKKVQEGIYQGFSIGGGNVKRDDKDSNKIISLRLSEISLVDRPANPECVFKVWKADKVSAEDSKKVEDIMQDDAIAKIDGLTAAVTKLTETVTTLAGKVSEIEKRPAVPENVVKLEGTVAKLTTDLEATRTATESAQRNGVIEKMTSEGRAPINPETSKGYTLDELQKVDLPTLRLLAVNSPVVPIYQRSLLKKGEGIEIDPKLTGINKAEAAFNRDYPNFAALKNGGAENVRKSAI